MTATTNNDPLTEKIIGCCFNVHSALGPGFNERIYFNALKIELEENGLKYETEKDCRIDFHNERVGSLRLDLLVEDKVIVEIKGVTGNIPEIFRCQILSYLKATKLSVGLLVNFGNRSCQVKRLVV